MDSQIEDKNDMDCSYVRDKLKTRTSEATEDTKK